MSEPEQPSCGPASTAQLACAAAIVAAVIVRLPVQRFVFLGERMGFYFVETPEGRTLAWAALVGSLLAAAQLVFLCRPARGTIRHRVAVVTAVAGLWLGVGIAALGVYVGFLHELDPRMHQTVGPGALLAIAAGLSYAGLAGRTAVRLVVRSQRATPENSPLGQSRARRAAVLFLPGIVVLVVLTTVALGRRTGGGVEEDADDWQQPAPAGVREELERLRGEWVVVRTEPPDVTPAGARLAIEGDRMTAIGRPSRPEPFRLDPTRRPKEIDIPIWVNNVRDWSRAIYELDGDRLTLCTVVFTPETGPDAGLHLRPRSFTDRGTAYVWHFERQRMPAP